MVGIWQALLADLKNPLMSPGNGFCATTRKAMPSGYIEILEGRINGGTLAETTTQAHRKPSSNPTQLSLIKWWFSCVGFCFRPRLPEWYYAGCLMMEPMDKLMLPSSLSTAGVKVMLMLRALVTDCLVEKRLTDISMPATLPLKLDRKEGLGRCQNSNEEEYTHYK